AAELGAPLDDRLPADTGIEPDVEDVRLETEARPRAAGAGESGRYQLGGRTPEPGVGPLALEDVRDVRAQGLAGDRLAARLAVARDPRHAPAARARDAPVRPRRDHVRDPPAAPAGYPAHARDLGERAAAELGPLHADEPLLGRPEDDRVLAPPAVRIAVAHGLGGDETAARPEVLDDARIGVEDAHALPLRDVGGGATPLVDRCQHVEAVADARLVVLLAVAGRGVDEPRASLERDVLGEHDGHGAIEPGMPAAGPVERRTGETGADRAAAEPRRERGQERRSDDQRAAAELGRYVLVLRMDRDSEARGERPRRRRPDRRRGVVGAREHVRERRDERVRDVDRGRRVVAVLDLRLGERGPARRAPEDGLLTAVDEAGSDAAAERTDLLCLVAGGHGEVRML